MERKNRRTRLDFASNNIASTAFQNAATKTKRPTRSQPKFSTLRRPSLEFVVVFVALPLIAAWQGPLFKKWIIPQLLVLAALALAMLWRDPSFDRRPLRSVPPDWSLFVRRIVVFFILGGTVLLFLTIAFSHIRVFLFPYQRPILWFAVLVLYPLVSAVTQELIFRVFVFHRYRTLFPNAHTMLVASAGTFALAHLQLGNALAPALSLIGGLRFAYTYRATRSLALVSLEHGLWGDWIFTIGLGAFFYGGAL